MLKMSFEGILAIVVALIIFLLDKAGKNNMWTTIILLIIMTGFCLLAALQIPWIWSSDVIAFKYWRVSLVVTAVLLSCSWFGIWIWPKPLTEKTKQATAEEIAKEIVKRIPGLVPESPKSESPTFREKVEKVTISLGGGGITSIYSLSSLRAGSAEPFNFGGYKPVRIYLEKDRLFADVSIYGGPDQAPIEIKHNDFVVRAPGCDRNFDQTVLEVINISFFPVFQFIYRTPYQIIINGIFPSPAGLVLANDDGFRTGLSSIPKSFRIIRLFKYPSNQFPGHREEEVRVVPKPKLRERAIAISNELSIFANEEEKTIMKILQNPDPSGRTEIVKISMKFASIYDEKYALQCGDIAEEIAATGINVGRLPSRCRMMQSFMDSREIARELRILGERLP